MFMVSKNNILKYNIQWYKNIFDEISVWQSEVNHYLERSWFVFYNQFFISPLFYITFSFLIDKISSIFSFPRFSPYLLNFSSYPLFYITSSFLIDKISSIFSFPRFFIILLPLVIILYLTIFITIFNTSHIILLLLLLF